MKRHWIFRIVCILLAIIIPWMIKSFPRPLLDKDCSPLYQRYADDPGVEASFVKGFRISDTLTIDATLLRAKDSAGWERLREDFNLPPTLLNDTCSPKGKNITVSLRKKGQTKNVTDTNRLNNDYVAISMPEHLIGIYHITDSAQWYACVDYYLQSIKNISL